MTTPRGLIVEDIVYASPGGIPLLARLYQPQGDGPFPGELVPKNWTEV